MEVGWEGGSMHEGIYGFRVTGRREESTHKGIYGFRVTGTAASDFSSPLS
jgi:hypothetical protein